MEVNAVAIDIAKSVFQVLAVNRAEKVIFCKQIRRDKLMAEMAKLAPTTVFMEACGSAHYWARRFGELGHDVKLIAGQHVKRYVTGNKNDTNDARAIVTCGLRPETRFVPIKSPRSLAAQALHRVRRRLIAERTALSNEIRGLLYEHGVVLPVGLDAMRRELSQLPEGLEPDLRETVDDLIIELSDKSKRVAVYERRIAQSAKQQPVCQRLETIRGVGPITSTAVTAEVVNPRQFKNGREFAAFLGLVPRHSGTGGKVVNQSISKRGDGYLRTLLIQGAQSVLRHTAERQDPLSLWCQGVVKRRGKHKAVVALANKNARIIWRLMTSEDTYRSDLAAAALVA